MSNLVTATQTHCSQPQPQSPTCSLLSGSNLQPTFCFQSQSPTLILPFPILPFPILPFPILPFPILPFPKIPVPENPRPRKSPSPKIPMGEFLFQTRQAAVFGKPPKNFFRVGGPSVRRTAPAHNALRAYMSADALRYGRRLTVKSASIFVYILPHFCRCLSAVARMAQRLEITRVNEQCPIATVRHDVIHVSGSCADISPSTISAEGLTKKLRRSQSLSKDW